MSTAESDAPGPAVQSTMPNAVSPEPTAPRTIDSTADPGSNAEPSPPQKRPEPKLCVVCGANPGNCSVACNKQHKENHPPDLPKPEPSATATNANNPSNPQSQEQKEDPYSILLDHRDTFQRLFNKYPSLPAALARIQETTLPPPQADAAGDPFSKFPSLRGNMPRHRQQQHQQPWTRDVGLRRGAEALRRARTDPSDTGDGVREFCDLVRFLLSKKEEGQGGRGGGEVVELVREEVLAEETRAIARLMREEGG
ncbi:88b58092-5795-49a1-bac9-4ae6c3a80600 [Thermothielavioides terrestris]|uniref:88b58092-5795-49a1-bac9-4ae6c3a80600 n=1 Tax=Thermothielavioides terrestris TaxID=2587410 RepID=A0A3S4F8C8_9PEZI|nr:88b58092-5795-49a1-bac9-4ae6c3a80600 [Thermothielavioides terrestris]